MTEQSVPLNVQPYLDAARRLGDALYHLGQLWGLPDYRAQKRHRRAQAQLRNHVMRVNAGNRRRQAR